MNRDQNQKKAELGHKSQELGFLILTLGPARWLTRRLGDWSPKPKLRLESAWQRKKWKNEIVKKINMYKKGNMFFQIEKCKHEDIEQKMKEHGREHRRDTSGGATGPRRQLQHQHDKEPEHTLTLEAKFAPTASHDTSRSTRSTEHDFSVCRWLSACAVSLGRVEKVRNSLGSFQKTQTSRVCRLCWAQAGFFFCRLTWPSSKSSEWPKQIRYYGSTRQKTQCGRTAKLATPSPSVPCLPSLSWDTSLRGPAPICFPSVFFLSLPTVVRFCARGRFFFFAFPGTVFSLPAGVFPVTEEVACLSRATVSNNLKESRRIVADDCNQQLGKTQKSQHYQARNLWFFFFWNLSWRDGCILRVFFCSQTTVKGSMFSSLPPSLSVVPGHPPDT